MKSSALKELERLAMEQKRREHPTMPDHALPKTKFTDSSTNSLTKAILKTFEVYGFFATRIDSKGTYNQALKRFIPSNQKKGLPDIFCQVPGLPPVWVEVKCEATNDRLKPHQIAMIEKLRETGAIVFVAIDYEGFYTWFKGEVLTRFKSLLNHEKAAKQTGNKVSDNLVEQTAEQVGLFDAITPTGTQ